MSLRDQPQKIALLGLANAGKSSILKTILYEFDAFTGLLPTTGVDRTNIDFMGHDLILWDYGGQEIYRDTYLNKPAMYFQGIKYLYYVIDAQDLDKIGETIEYFKKSFEYTMKYSDNVKIYLFFHKIDPDYEGSVNFIQVEKNFLIEVLPEIKKFDITPVAFHTSIKNPRSVISAFSQPLLGNQTIYDTLCDSIDSFCFDQDLPFGMVFIDNFEIGHYFASDEIENYVNERIEKYLISLDSVEDTPEYLMGDFEIHTRRFILYVGDEEFIFNFAVGIDPLDAPDEVDDIFTAMDDFTDNLEKILINSEIIRSGELRTSEIWESSEIMDEEERNERIKSLEGLEDEDKTYELQRERELDIIGDQYADMDMDSDDDEEDLDDDEEDLDDDEEDLDDEKDDYLGSDEEIDDENID